jgi:hypothetical protein
MSTGEPFWSLGFRFRDLSWVSDCSTIPDSTTAKIAGSKVLVIDGLKRMCANNATITIPVAILGAVFFFVVLAAVDVLSLFNALFVQECWPFFFFFSVSFSFNSLNEHTTNQAYRTSS